MSEWQPIETAPRDGAEVRLKDAAGREYEKAVYVGYPAPPAGDGGWYELNKYGRPRVYLSGLWFPAVTPTHWMPIPDPPKAP